MIRIPLLAIALTAGLATPALADPDALCGLEEVNDPALATCPSYITYDEDGEEIGGASGQG